jgi:hypothetical protein
MATVIPDGQPEERVQTVDFLRDYNFGEGQVVAVGFLVSRLSSRPGRKR